MKPKIARIAVRPDEDNDSLLILGMDEGLFKPGFVYEISQVEGGFAIRECGESVATPENHPPGACWDRDVSGIVIDGRHLLTAEEDARQDAAHTEEYRINKWWNCDELTREQKDHYRDLQNAAEKKAGNHDWIVVPRPEDVPQHVGFSPYTVRGSRDLHEVAAAIHIDSKKAEELIENLKKTWGADDGDMVRMTTMNYFNDDRRAAEEDEK